MEPMTLFIREAMALDVEIVDRLRRLPGVSEEDVAPLRDLPVLPHRLLGRWAGYVFIAALLAVGAKTAGIARATFLEVWRGQPALAQMTHATGELHGFSGCGRDVIYQGHGIDATLSLANGRPAHAWIPCVMPRGVFSDQRRHTLAVDSWADGDAQPVVYQVVLDDRPCCPTAGCARSARACCGSSP